VKSFVTFRISLDFFSTETRKFASEKIKKIDTYSECYETLHIIYMYFIEVSVTPQFPDLKNSLNKSIYQSNITKECHIFQQQNL